MTFIQGLAWDTSPIGFRVRGTEIPGTHVPGTRNPRDSWDFGQISLGVPGTGKFSCSTALGQFGTIRNNRPKESQAFWLFQACPMGHKSLGLLGPGTEIPVSPWDKNARKSRPMSILF